MKIIKRSGTEVAFDITKIENAIRGANKDVAERLKEIDASLYAEVKKVLSKNLAERHIRGGNATRIKYARTKVRSPAKK